MPSKTQSLDVLYHTDQMLREHRALAKQDGWGRKAKFSLVDWQTYRPLSKRRENAYWADQGE